MTGYSKSQLLRTEVLAAYRKESRPSAKNNIGNLIIADQSFEMIPILMKWTQQFDAPGMRIDGFRLMSQLPPSSESYLLIKLAVMEEKDESVLAAAKWALNFPGNVIDPSEIKDLVPRLHALTRHDSHEVRAASIQRLAKWDLSRRYIEEDILRIIGSDTNLDSMFAAVGASTVACISSVPLKIAFFKILENADSDVSLRSVFFMASRALLFR